MFMYVDLANNDMCCTSQLHAAVYRSAAIMCLYCPFLHLNYQTFALQSPEAQGLHS